MAGGRGYICPSPLPGPKRGNLPLFRLPQCVSYIICMIWNNFVNFYATLLWQCHCLHSVSNDSVTAVNYERTIVALMSNKRKNQHRQNSNSKILNRIEDETGQKMIMTMEAPWEIQICCMELRQLPLMNYHHGLFLHIHIFLIFHFSIDICGQVDK